MPRGLEKDGHDYYFLSPDVFRKRISLDDFLEWEEVYETSPHFLTGAYDITCTPLHVT